MSQLKIILLGTGGSWPTVKRNVTSIAIKRDSEVILFDCGEGTQRQFQKSKLSYMQIDKIFITHFHGDHFLGLPGLIQTMQLNDREKPLYIYGPPGIIDLVEKLLSLGYFKPKYEIYASEIKDGEKIDFNDYIITPFKVEHGVPTYGYCLEEKHRAGKFDKPKALKLGIPEGPLFSKLQRGDTIILDDGRKIMPDMVLGPKRPGRKIVFTGDTKPCENTLKYAKKADVLIHEATFDDDLEETALEYGHSTIKHATELAKKASVNMLILTHISPRYLNTNDLLDHARKIFKKTYIPKDFDEFEIKLKK